MSFEHTDIKSEDIGFSIDEKKLTAKKSNNVKHAVFKGKRKKGKSII